MYDLFRATLGAAMLKGFQDGAGLLKNVMTIALGGNAAERVTTRNGSNVTSTFVQSRERSAGEKRTDFFDDVTRRNEVDQVGERLVLDCGKLFGKGSSEEVRRPRGSTGRRAFGEGEGS